VGRGLINLTQSRDVFSGGFSAKPLSHVRVESDWIIPAYRAYDRPTLTGPVSQIIQAAIDEVEEIPTETTVAKVSTAVAGGQGGHDRNRDFGD
jgi:hypothetical protein